MSRVIEFPGRGRKAARTTTSESRRTPASPRRAPRKGARDRVLSRLLNAPNGRDLLVAIALHRTRGITPVDAVCPPGSLLDAVVSTIRDDTDLPPETGLAAVLAILAAAMAQAENTVRWPDVSEPIEMALWIVLLAPSSAGKSFVACLVTEALGLQLRKLPEPGSGAAYLDSLASCGGRAYWPRDEYGQLIAQLAEHGPMAVLRDLLLRTYDHSPIENNTRRNGQVFVEKPVLTIFGASVSSTWSSCVDVRMLSDGLLARHLFVVAEGRPLSVSRYPRDAMLGKIRNALSPELVERMRQRVEYRISDTAAEYYDREWQKLARSISGSVDPAYFRRVTWTTARLAVFYHLMLDEPSDLIGEGAMQWAWRLTMLMVGYVRAALELSDPTFTAKLTRMLEWADANTGRYVTRPRLGRALLTRFSRDLGSASEARYLIDFVWKLRGNAE